MGFTRRKFLAGSTAASASYLLAAHGIANAIVQGLHQRVMADAGVGLVDCLYFHFNHHGGPPRYYFDMPMNPTGDQTISSSPLFGNAFAFDNQNNASLRNFNPPVNVNGRTVYMPPLWQTSVPTSAGNIPLSSILSNMMIIRGINQGNDNHQFGQSRQIAPAVGGHSINGVLSDRTSFPLAPIVSTGGDVIGAHTAFKSKMGAAPILLPGTPNPLSFITKSFKVDGFNPATNPQLDSAIDSAMLEIDAYAVENISKNPLLKVNRQSAKSLVKRTFANLDGSWASLVTKYKNLIRASVDMSMTDIPGVTDRPIKAGAYDPKWSIGDNKAPYTNDLRPSMKDYDYMFMTNIGMAEAFAISEFLVREKLSASYTHVLSNPKVQFPGIQSYTDMSISGPHGVDFYHDQHGIGTLASLMYTTVYWRAFITCVAELVNVLKSEGVWNKSMIHMAGDFNRIPNGGGHGTDHGWNGDCTSIVSGMVQGGPLIVGNLVANSMNNGVNVGTWGHAAPMNIEGVERTISMDDVGNTLCSILGLSPVSPNGVSLATVRDGRVQLIYNSLRNIA